MKDPLCSDCYEVACIREEIVESQVNDAMQGHGEHGNHI